jgi:hypothetical protein
MPSAACPCATRRRGPARHNPTTHNDITTAVNHPTTRNQGLRVNCVMTRRLVARFVMTTIMGATMMPLMTVLQYSARIWIERRKITDRAAAAATASVA